MDENNFFLPPEWHNQRCIELAWPDENTDWKPYLKEIRLTIAEIIKAITRFENVILAARNAEDALSYMRKALPEEGMKRLIAAECPLNDTWARDFGGITLLSKDLSKAQILDFRFNGWGGKFPSADDNRTTRILHEKGILKGQLVCNDDFILEGGSIESDGQGTVFTTSHCLLAPHRNAGPGRTAIENQLKRRLKAARIVWLNNGKVIGDDTDGHIDTMVRVCPGDTLLYIRCGNDDAHFPELSALEGELKALTTLGGKPYRLLPLPLPRPIVFNNERLPATYANFLVINGAVIVPVYGQSDLDEEACATIGNAFPGREIIPVDATIIIRQHGSIHCLAMQYPATEGEETAF